MTAAIFVFITGTLFFSVNAVALRIFSAIKLKDAFGARRGEEKHKRHFENLVSNSEKLYLTCSLYRLVFNVCILVTLLAFFRETTPGGMRIADYIKFFVAATAIVAIFSLVVPHAWAKYAGEKILSRTHEMLFFFTFLASPILYFFTLHDRIVRKLTGTMETSPQEQQEEKEEEFLTELELHKIHGAVDAEEQQMIENVLKLSERYAGEIMTPRTDIAAVEVNSDLQSVLKTITTAGNNRFPVYEGTIDNIVGLLYAKDLLNEIGKDAAQFKLRDKLRPAYFVPQAKPLRALLREFQKKKLHIAVLLDEYGGTAGIITLEDILEQLVGEIADEYKKTAPQPIKEIDTNTVEVDARTNIADLNRQLEMNLPESEDYDTIGGFIFSHLGCIPKTGKSFDYENRRFTITSAEPRKIKKITISKIAPVETQI